MYLQLCSLHIHHWEKLPSDRLKIDPNKWRSAALTLVSVKWNIVMEIGEMCKTEYCSDHHPQIWPPWQTFGWTSHVFSHLVTHCWVENAGTLRTNITILFTTWWFKEAVSVTDTPASVCPWLESTGTFSPSLAWYGVEPVWNYSSFSD